MYIAKKLTSFTLIEFISVVGSKLALVRLLTLLASYETLFAKVPPQKNFKTATSNDYNTAMS